MLKIIICLIAILSLTACGGDSGSASTSNETKGTFKATMGDKTIDIAVKCHNFDNDKFDTEFVFASDNVFGNKDTDGDGIIVRGDRVKIGKDKSPIPIDGMSLDVVIDGIRYSADPPMSGLAKNQSWTKNANGISGKDQLRKEDDPTLKGYPISYEVVCK